MKSKLLTTLFLSMSILLFISCNNNADKLDGKTFIYKDNSNPELKWNLFFKFMHQGTVAKRYRVSAVLKNGKTTLYQGTGDYVDANTSIRIYGIRNDNVAVGTNFWIYTFQEGVIPMIFKEETGGVFELVK